MPVNSVFIKLRKDTQDIVYIIYDNLYFVYFFGWIFHGSGVIIEHVRKKG